VPDAPGTAPDTTAPVLTGVSLSRRRIQSGQANTSTMLRLSSSEAGRLVITIERVRRGHRVTHNRRIACRLVRQPADQGPCTVYQRIARLSRELPAGRDTVAIRGQLGGRRLAAGSYRLTAFARDAAGNSSTPIRRLFTVLPT
jgi:hypothetical protein